VRRGFLEEAVDADASAMVVTLESFFPINRELREKIIEEAISFANKEGNITAEDRRHILFCPIYGLKEILCRSTEETFLSTLTAAREAKYVGWELHDVHRDQIAQCSRRVQEMTLLEQSRTIKASRC
jgi:hypothetical protein